MWFDQPGKPGPMRGLTRIELDKMKEKNRELQVAEPHAV